MSSASHTSHKDGCLVVQLTQTLLHARELWKPGPLLTNSAAVGWSFPPSFGIPVVYSAVLGYTEQCRTQLFCSWLSIVFSNCHSVHGQIINIYAETELTQGTVRQKCYIKHNKGTDEFPELTGFFNLAEWRISLVPTRIKTSLLQTPSFRTRSRRPLTVMPLIHKPRRFAETGNDKDQLLTQFTALQCHSVFRFSLFYFFKWRWLLTPNLPILLGTSLFWMANLTIKLSPSNSKSPYRGLTCK